MPETFNAMRNIPEAVTGHESWCCWIEKDYVNKVLITVYMFGKVFASFSQLTLKNLHKK